VNAASNGRGGGISNIGVANLANTVVSGNSATIIGDVTGSYNDLGGNVIGATDLGTVNAMPVNLAPFGNYGGPMQTMIPLPGSPAICAGSSSLIPAGVTTDQRGFPNTNTTYPGYTSTTPCVDAGAVQSNYAIGFSTQPPSNGVTGVALNPAPAVSLTESSAPISVSGGTVAMSDAASLLTGTLSEAITSGVATFGNLVFPSATTGDTLIATLALTSSINLSTQATTEITAELSPQTIAFAALPAVTFGAAPFGLSATASSGLAVSFASTTAPVCTVTGSTATLVAAGVCTIKATQAGDVEYAAAAPVYQSFTVHGEAQTITFASIPATSLAAGSVALNATASSGLPVSYASTTISVCTVSASTATLVAVGTCTIEAKQPGGSGYDSAAWVTQSFKVTLTTQTISFAALPAVTYGAAPFSLSATASSGLAVSFASTTAPVCTVTGSTVTLVAAGTCTIDATQAGDTAYSAAAPVYQSFAVHGEAQTITFPTIQSTTLATGSVGLNATASSGLPVSYTSTTLPVCTVASNTVTLVAVGTCTIEAKQPGGSGYDAAAWVTESFKATLAPQTITFAAPPAVTYGAAPFGVIATASSGLAVSFASTTATVCTVSGSTATLVAPGTCTIDATQAGNGSYTAATPVYQSFIVHSEAQTITFPAIPATPLSTGSVTLNATASSGLQVSYASTTSSVCTVTANTVTLVAAGTCTIEAKQPGGSDYAPAAWVTQSFKVTAN
jgi:hypothetical protein